MANERECFRCHRVGTRGFKDGYGIEGVKVAMCASQEACERRIDRRPMVNTGALGVGSRILAMGTEWTRHRSETAPGYVFWRSTGGRETNTVLGPRREIRILDAR